MVDIADNTSTTATISVGGSTPGELETLGDHDWYRIQLTAGQAVTISLNGTGDHPVSDTYLILRDAAGTLIKSNDDGGPGLNSRIVFTPTTSGTYYIDVGSWEDRTSGTYTVSVSPYVAPPLWSLDQIAGELVSGYWAGSSQHFAVSQGGNLTVNLTGLTSSGQFLARQALGLWSDVTGIRFVEITSGGQIVFDDNEDGAFSTSEVTGGIITSSKVNVAVSWLSDYGSGLNSYSFQTYIHEIGHALGLGHAGDYNVDATYPDDVLYRNDSWSNSVMSYFSQTDNDYFRDLGFTENYALSPMGADVVAMASLYGLSTTTRTGNTTYGFNSTAGRAVYDATQLPNAAYTIFDNGGIDTLDYSGFSNNQLINLNPESFSNIGGNVGNVSIARGTIIENAIGGSGADQIYGTPGDNNLFGGPGNDGINGGAGNDTLSGGSGSDWLDGGPGNDRIIYDAADDPARVLGGSGDDTLVFVNTAAPLNYNLAAQGFEYAEVNQTDTGGNVWSTISSTYDAKWQLTAQDIRNDDGTRTYSAWDVGGTQSWKQVYGTYDAQGRQLSDDVRYDDGTRGWGAWDVAGTQFWTQVYGTFDAQGRQVSEDVHYDNGTRGWGAWDVAGSQAWTQVYGTYDAQGRKLTEDVHYDDGTRGWGAWDVAGNQSWSQVWGTFDAQGRQTSEDVRYDNGTRTLTTYDANNSQPWSQTASYYDAQGHLTQQVVTYDNGSVTYTNF